MQAYIITMMIFSLLGAGICLTGAANGKDVGVNAFAFLINIGFAGWGLYFLVNLP